MPFWNTDQKLDLLREFIGNEFDRLRLQNRRNTRHILRVMFRQHQETQTKLDKLLLVSVPVLKGELQFGAPIDKPASKFTSTLVQSTPKSQKSAVGGPPQRS